MPRILRRRAALTVVPVVAVLAISAILVATRAGSSSGGTGPQSDPVIASIGPDTILQSQFQARYQVALTTVQQSGGMPAIGTTPYQSFVASVRARVFESLAFDTVVAQQARLRGVLASPAQVDAEVAKDVSAAGGRSNLATQLAEAGSTIAAYEDETRSRLDEAALEDVWARDRAAIVLQRLSAGVPFDQVARDFSDDEKSRDSGGALGALSLDVLKSGDQTFYQAVLALGLGATSPAAVRDPAGYEVLRIDAATASTRTVHRILVAAPRPYTTKERPEWFYDFVLLALQQSCAAGHVEVVDASMPQLCGLATPTPSAAAGTAGGPATPGAAGAGTPAPAGQSGAAAPPASASPAARGVTPRPVP